MFDLPPEGAALLDRIRAIVPELEAQAAEGEEQRRIPDNAMAAIEATGVFRMLVPKSHGGLELDLDTFLEVGLAIAEADISTAWVTTFLIEHNWLLCLYPDSFQKELFADVSYVLAPAAVAPTGSARPVSGGHRLSGRWAWGTGVHHSTWIMVAAPEAGGGPETMRFYAMPKHDIRVEDTWFTDGMRATGSCDLVLDDVFIPEDRSIPMMNMAFGTSPGAGQHSAPLYRSPMLPVLIQAATMPLVGHAIAVARRYRERLQNHTRMNDAKSSAHRVASQQRLAEVTIEAHQAELLLRDVVTSVMQKRNEASPEERIRWAASCSHAVHQARRVVQLVATGSGASAHFERDPLQRAHRDINMATCHIVFDNDTQRENYGRLLLGFDPASMMF